MNDVTAVVKRKINKRKFTTVTVVVSVFLVACVFWWLKLIGITQTATPVCGKTEHVHSEECVERVLICELIEETTEAIGESEESETETTEVQTGETTEEATEETSNEESETTESSEAESTEAESTEAESTEAETTEAETTEAETTEAESTEAQAHVHTDSCYRIDYNCDGNGNELEEHEHSDSCYSDINADLETRQDWENSLPELSGIWTNDIVAIANSQLGQAESTLNYTLDEFGETHGITRYGQWYGNPYGDWNAMFVCFCLHYSGISESDFPRNTDVYSWETALKQAECWKAAATAIPFAGDLLFADTDNDGKADRVGIITEVSQNEITVIEGDKNNAVETKVYSRTDNTVLGIVMPGEEESIMVRWERMSGSEKVAYLISAIAALPSVEQAQETMEAFEDNDDSDGLAAYYNDLQERVEEIATLYRMLDPELRPQVDNNEILYAYADIFNIAVTATPQEKPERDNTADLQTVRSVDTRNFIELNLYDYGDNINDLFYDKKKKDKSKYPGFQQNGGDIVRTAFSRWGFGLGDNITSDNMAGFYNVTGSGGLVNSTYPGTRYPGINLPASLRDNPDYNPNYDPANTTENPNNKNKENHIQIMKWTLDDEGYPCAYEDNISYKYLFNEDVKDPNGKPYANKMNDKSITGLFKYNPSTGVYSYNSLENHAQYDRETDTFTLYKQRITPNFILYPFGNFLPFNDIIKQSQKAVDINESYFQTISNSALLKSQTLDSKYTNIYIEDNKVSNPANYKTPYLFLSQVLDAYITICKKSTTDGGLGGSNWTAMDLERKYYDLNPAIPAGNTLPNTYLDDLYNIDYDEETDFFFGMEMKMNFVQSRNGINAKGIPTVLKFTGDDDVFFYIDNVLFIDLSGIHRHVGGEIDFQKGEVRYYHLIPEIGDVDVENPANADRIESFAEILIRAGRGATKQELIDNGYLNENGTFPDFSTHRLNWYYMERGSGSGVCRIEFNLEQVVPSTIYKVNQYGESVPGAGFAIYPAEKVGNQFKYIMPNATLKTNDDILSVNEETGLITFKDNSTLLPVYTGKTDFDGSMIFKKEDGETMSMSDLKDKFKDHFIMREIKVPPGYRLVAAESWMSFINDTIYCENTLDSGTWAAANMTTMAMEKVYPSSSDDEEHAIPYYTRNDDGDIEHVYGTVFAVVMRKCADNGNHDEDSHDILNWHPVTGDDFSGYQVSQTGGINSAIAAAKSYIDPSTGGYTHVFDIGQMYFPELGNEVKLGMIDTIKELPGEAFTYYANVYAKYVDEHEGCTPAQAHAYAVENSNYAIAYFYTKKSLDEATSENTVRINPKYIGNSTDNQTHRDFQMQWSTDIQVPNVVNSLYLQKTDVSGNLLNDAVFALYPAIKGDEDRGEGYYLADNPNNDTQYYVRLDVNNSATDQDAVIYRYSTSNKKITKNRDAHYTIGTAEPDLENGVERGLLTDYKPGVITVTADDGSKTVTLTPVTNAEGKYMIGTTHDSCSTVVTPGTGHFSQLTYDPNERDAGRYFLKEIYAPEGYALSRENVKVVVLPNAVYANAGTKDNHITVGNGPGYLVKTLYNFATKASIADSLCWTYGVLRVDNSTDFADEVFLKDAEKNHFAVDDIANDGRTNVSTGTAPKNDAQKLAWKNGDPYNNTPVMIAYYEFAGKDQPNDVHTKLFDYKQNTREEWSLASSTPDTAVPGVGNELILWTQQGWSDLSIYQDNVYGEKVTELYPHSTYANYGSKDLVNLFSISTFVQVSDDDDIKLQLIKEDGVDPDVKLEGAEFILKMISNKDINHPWSASKYLYYDDERGEFRPKKSGETDDDFIVTTSEDGLIALNTSLLPGVYVLSEKNPPLGYKKLSYDIVITVSYVTNPQTYEKTISFTAQISGAENIEPLEVEATPQDNPNLFKIHIKNYTGYLLPATGGTGVYAYYAAGITLIALSVFCAYRLRRRKEKAI